MNALDARPFFDSDSEQWCNGDEERFGPATPPSLHDWAWFYADVGEVRQPECRWRDQFVIIEPSQTLTEPRRPD